MGTPVSCAADVVVGLLLAKMSVICEHGLARFILV